MTDITDQDRRTAREWAEKIDPTYRGNSEPLINAARVILATVDAPEPTIAEALNYRADLLDNGDPDGDTPHALRTLATRVEQLQHDRDAAHEALTLEGRRVEKIAHDRAEARAEVERLTTERDDYESMYLEARDEATALAEDLAGAESEVERLTAERDAAREEIAWLRNGPGHTEVATDLPDPAEAERLEGLNFDKQVREAINDHYDQYAVQEAAESNAETPTPADVKPGEAWIVEVNRQKRTAVKDNDAGVPWNTITTNGVFRAEDDDDVTLVTRLVPAPRVITDPDDLDRAKRDTIIRDARGVVCSRDSAGTAWTTFTNLTDQRRHIVLPATVLWEPDA